MARIIRKLKAASNVLVFPGPKEPDDRCLLRLLNPAKGETIRVSEPGYETLFVVLSGKADITVGKTHFSGVGRRADIWSGLADSVYAGTGQEIAVTALAPGTEIAIAGGRCAEPYAPFRIPPEEVSMVDVGSPPTHSHRRIFHILGQNGTGRAGNLLVSELYADPGCWSGYPPHKHDTERPPEETDFQEVYHYRFRPASGFGMQVKYDPGEEPQIVMTRDGDTFVVDRGYHPTSTSPGHEGYIFTILVGRNGRSLIQYFDPAHAHLMSVIPGIQAMRDKFK